MGYLDGKVAVVTGSGRGIARGIALLMAEEGAKVVVNDYGVNVDGTEPRSEIAEEVVAEIRSKGGTAVASADSVADWDGSRRIIETAVKNFGKIDILCNVAGILRDRMVFNMSEEEWDAVIATHLKGNMFTTRHAAPYMIKQRWGRILNFSSGAGYGNSGQANYASAKEGIAGFTYAMAPARRGPASAPARSPARGRARAWRCRQQRADHRVAVHRAGRRGQRAAHR